MTDQAPARRGPANRWIISTLIVASLVTVASAVIETTTRGPDDLVGLGDAANTAIDRDHHLYVPLSAWAGAQRIPRLEMPNAPGRASILGALVQYGPRSPAQLARLVGVDRTTIRHHARVLARNGFLRIVNDGRRTALMLPDQEPVAQAPAPVASTRIMRLVSEAGGTITRAELHRLMSSAARRSVNHAIRHLIATRWLERTQVHGFDALKIVQDPTKRSPSLAQEPGTHSALAEHVDPRPESSQMT